MRSNILNSRTPRLLRSARLSVRSLEFGVSGIGVTEVAADSVYLAAPFFLCKQFMELYTPENP